MQVQKKQGGSFLFKNEDPRENVILYPNGDKYATDSFIRNFSLDTRDLSMEMEIQMDLVVIYSKILALYMYVFIFHTTD